MSHSSSFTTGSSLCRLLDALKSANPSAALAAMEKHNPNNFRRDRTVFERDSLARWSAVFKDLLPGDGLSLTDVVQALIEAGFPVRGALDALVRLSPRHFLPKEKAHRRLLEALIAHTSDHCPDELEECANVARRSISRKYIARALVRLSSQYQTVREKFTAKDTTDEGREMVRLAKYASFASEDEAEEDDEGLDSDALAEKESAEAEEAAVVAHARVDARNAGQHASRSIMSNRVHSHRSSSETSSSFRSSSPRSSGSSNRHSNRCSSHASRHHDDVCESRPHARRSKHEHKRRRSSASRSSSDEDARRHDRHRSSREKAAPAAVTSRRSPVTGGRTEQFSAASAGHNSKVSTGLASSVVVRGDLPIGSAGAAAIAVPGPNASVEQVDSPAVQGTDASPMEIDTEVSLVNEMAGSPLPPIDAAAQVDDEPAQVDALPTVSPSRVSVTDDEPPSVLSLSPSPTPSTDEDATSSDSSLSSADESCSLNSQSSSNSENSQQSSQDTFLSGFVVSEEESDESVSRSSSSASRSDSNSDSSFQPSSSSDESVDSEESHRMNSDDERIAKHGRKRKYRHHSRSGSSRTDRSSHRDHRPRHREESHRSRSREHRPRYASEHHVKRRRLNRHEEQ